MGLVHLNEAVHRKDVGDHDEELWPRNEDGDQEDPWAPTKTVEMKDPATGQQFTFTTGSKGGTEALQRLGSQWRSQIMKHEGKLPVVEIDAGSYRHKTWGKVYKPVFRIVSWETPEDLKNGKSSDTAAFLDDEIPDLTGDKS